MKVGAWSSLKFWTCPRCHILKSLNPTNPSGPSISPFSCLLEASAWEVDLEDLKGCSSEATNAAAIHFSEPNIRWDTNPYWLGWPRHHVSLYSTRRALDTPSQLNLNQTCDMATVKLTACSQIIAIIPCFWFETGTNFAAFRTWYVRLFSFSRQFHSPLRHSSPPELLGPQPPWSSLFLAKQWILNQPKH